MNGKVADDFQLVVAALTHALRLEGNGGILGGVEVVGALQIVIAVFVARIDGIHIHRRVDARLGHVAVVDRR